MAIDLDSNNATFFGNKNVCKSFNQFLTTAYKALSTQECSEVIVVNKTGDTIQIYDLASPLGSPMLMDDNDTFTFRGVTNSNQLSAKGTLANLLSTTPLYYRTQDFSYLPQ